MRRRHCDAVRGTSLAFFSVQMGGSKMGIGFLLIAALLAGCGTNKPVDLLSSTTLSGTWALAKIRCDSQESALFADTVFQKGVAVDSAVTFGNDGKAVRTWHYSGCELKTPMSTIAYAPGTISAADADTACTGTCGGLPGCMAKATPTLSYPYNVVSNELTITLPDGGKPPAGVLCGAGQTQATLDLIYKRVQ
jgi:hypothetical protein